ncbi:MAG TPA: disulfide bond formation protein B [Casimicrobiaceae bacterium]|jgi:disulfide bond formation protein DsbB|nr:disulfide bond formation protein B [Casimicrobiaceae bacterium]
MDTAFAPEPRARAVALFNYTFLLLVLAVVAGILVAAMAMQYLKGELPCPLCLLQRVAMLGVCFGIVLSLRGGFSYRYTGISLVSAVFLLIVAARQTLLDIYPRPGHAYIGSAVLGMHMPVWSVIVALALLLAYAVEMAVLGRAASLDRVGIERFPRLQRIAGGLCAVVVAIAVINLVSAFVQCGLGECHTFSYKLLS